MKNVERQNAARELDRYCAELGIRALIGISPAGGLVVYAKNRQAFRKGSKLLPKKWKEYDLTIQSYVKSRAGSQAS